MPKIVYSRTLERADWNTTIVRDVVPEEVMALKEQAGGDLGLGGADLAAAFLRHDLVDELRVYVHPVLIGRGKPLFPHTGTATGPPSASPGRGPSATESCCCGTSVPGNRRRPAASLPRSSDGRPGQRVRRREGRRAGRQARTAERAAARPAV